MKIKQAYNRSLKGSRIVTTITPDLSSKSRIRPFLWAGVANFDLLDHT
ncbi:MAG: hypothetical protein OEY88_01095 [Candidatus Bathyarchaeota archaeon]|nr:hypothetical protein [Candidatus Bathyarchaeota archaeon]